MATLLWLLRNGAAESLLIFSIFHLLLAGLTLLVLLYQLRPARESGEFSDHLLALAFALFGACFALRTLYFGACFFYGTSPQPAGVERFVHGLLSCGFILLIPAFQCHWSERRTLLRWLVPACAAVLALTVVDVASPVFPLSMGGRPHSLAMLFSDLVSMLVIAICIVALTRRQLQNGRVYVAAFILFGMGLLLHLASGLVANQEVIVNQAEEVIVSASLFGFAWATGERSPKLLDRIFVRLNLAFIVLASLIMLATAGMEKYQYMKLAEQRSVQFAEFLRNEFDLYRGRGEDLEQVLRHPAVLDRVLAEFANIPELRKVNIYVDNQRATFRYGDLWDIKQEIVPASAPTSAEPANSFQMLRIPLENGSGTRNHIELLGTMDYINRYIGKYIILIYAVFTIVVVVATGVIGIIVAETDRLLQRKYAEVEESHRRLAHAAKLASVGELAGGMAHEINTPITSILSLASHMSDDSNSANLTPRQRNSLRLIARQAERVSRIVGGLLNFSRQTQLHLSQVEVSEVVETAITLIQYRLDQQGIRLQREFAPGLSVRADAGALTEVILNLLTNAIDAMPIGGALTVRSSPNQDGGVRVEVIDAGIGILAEQLPRIFDPFYTTKEPGRGTGLGLSVSHGIVKRHGGEIWAESEPGVGTTFVVTLPLEAKA